jgi:hypothetical protein
MKSFHIKPFTKLNLCHTWDYRLETLSALGGRQYAADDNISFNN